MPIEIEGIRLRRGWTSTSAIATHKAPFAGLGVVRPSPVKTTTGIEVSVVTESDRRIGLEEFNILFLPVLEALNLEVVGKPKLVVEDSPIWVWRKYMYGDREDLVFANPEDRKYPTWIATIATGPLKGHEGDWRSPVTCLYRVAKEQPDKLLRCKIGPPTAEDTAELAKIVEKWTVRLRRREPTESIKSKIREVGKAVAQSEEKLATFTREWPQLNIAEAQVEVARPKARGGAVATAAIIGIALSLLTWSQRRS